MSADRKKFERSVYSPLDRATVPPVVEENSESVWAKFEALQRGEPLAPTLPPPLGELHGTGSYDTTQMLEPDALLGEGSYEATQALEPGWRAGETQQPALRWNAPRAPQKALSLDEVMVVARRNNRACPLPPQWEAFHQLLPIRELHGHQLVAPQPITGPDWAAASPMQKRLRLRDQIEWAERTGALMAAYDFLLALPEEAWLHFSD